MAATVHRIPLQPVSDGVRTAAPPAGSAFAPLRLYRGDGGTELSGTTDQEEAGLLVLAGTFDLRAGGNAWGSRGARPDPFAGRPVAVFLPPRTPFAAAGSGEFLVLGAVPPPAPEVTGHAALSHKPLLPLAGSGKAFDPRSGEWKTAEEFPSSPQALLPRHIRRVELDGAVVERVFAPDYKAFGFSLDEAVVQDGAQLGLERLPDRAAGARELLLYLRPRARAEVRTGGVAIAVDGEAVFAVALDGTGDVALAARGGPCYAVLGWAGK